MKKTNALYCITAGNPKKLIKPVVWTVFADLVNLFPFCLLALVVGSIYLYFGGTSETLDVKRLWFVWGGMVTMMAMMPAQGGVSSLRSISGNCLLASL